MFHGVSHARHIRLITEIAHIHIQGCACLVCLRVVNQEAFQLVRQTNNAITAIVE